MRFIAIAFVFVMTFGGLMVAAGVDAGLHLIVGAILPAMPAEMMIIFGVACCAFVIANPMDVVKQTLGAFRCIKQPAAHDKDSYVDLLSLLFTIFKMARTKGWLSLEQHIEQPQDSDLFGQFNRVQNNHHALTFLCDYLRIISLGNDSPHEIEALMDEEIGSALVGTFLGVWLSYGFAAPFAGAMLSRAHTEIMYYRCIKAGIIAFLNGAAPQVAVEFSRKLLPHDVQPSFLELEEKLNELPAIGG